MIPIRPTPRLLLITTIGVVLVACERSPRLSGEAFDLGPEPVTVQFTDSARVAGPSWELCFEFEHSGDSHQAGSITARLVAEDGSRTPVRILELDRRGERIVCLIASPEEAHGKYTAVELASPTTLMVRTLHGGVLADQ